MPYDTNKKYNLMSMATRSEPDPPVNVSNEIGRGFVVVINVTSIVSGGTLTVNVYGLDASKGSRYLIIASAAISTTGVYTLKCYPALTAAANAVVNDIAPRDMLVSATHGGTAGSISYSVGMSVIL